MNGARCLRQGRVLLAGALILALALAVVFVWRQRALSGQGGARGSASGAAGIPPPSVRGEPLRSAPRKSEAVAAPSAPAARAGGEDAWIPLDVADLSNFDYEEQSGDLPPEILAWNDKRVELHGFMNPTRFTKDGVAEFMLTAFPGACCFGSIPRLNEWVVVRMPEGKSTDYAYTAPIVVLGRLEVGEEIVDEVVQSLYRMEAQRVVVED